LFTLSLPRADQLRARIAAALAGDVRFKARVHQPLNLEAAGRPGPMYVDSQKVAGERSAQRFQRSVRRAWLSESLPALGGATPLEAAKTAAGRRKLDTILKSMEHRVPPGVEEEIAWLRGELGVSAGGKKKRPVAAKMSDTIVELVDPILVEIVEGDVREFQEVFDLAAKAWNAAVLIEGEGASATELRDRAIRELMPEDEERAKAWFDALVARKRALFAHDRRIVGEVVIEARDGELGVRTSFLR
jgi:hypothetical protein